MKRIIYTFLAILLLLVFTSSRTIETTIMKMYKTPRGLFYVDLKVNDKSGDFLIDTGASFSILDVSKSKRYDFEFQSDKNQKAAIGIGGVCEKYNVSNYKTKYKNEDLDLKFKGMNLFTLSQSFRVNHDINLIGIVGSDFLIKNNAIIDYYHGEIILHK